MRSTPSKCYGCGGELREGTRFCVLCGTNNFDAAAGRLTAAEFEIGASDRKRWFESFVYWLRHFSGIRR